MQGESEEQETERTEGSCQQPSPTASTKLQKLMEVAKEKSSSSWLVALPIESHEGEKLRAYEQCVHEVEQGSFMPLVFSTSGGMGRAATVVYKRLASLLSSRCKQPYSMVMGWLRSRCKSRSQNLIRSTSPRGTYPPHGLIYHNNLFLFYVTCQYVTNWTPLYIWGSAHVCLYYSYLICHSQQLEWYCTVYCGIHMYNSCCLCSLDTCITHAACTCMRMLLRAAAFKKNVASLQVQTTASNEPSTLDLMGQWIAFILISAKVFCIVICTLYNVCT